MNNETMGGNLSPQRSRIRRALFLLLFSALALFGPTGCGRKGDPVSPDDPVISAHLNPLT